MIKQYVAELGGNLPPMEMGLVAQAAALMTKAEALQRSMRRGEAVSVDDMVRASSETRRTVSALKRERARARPATHDLSEYLAAKEQEKNE